MTKKLKIETKSKIVKTTGRKPRAGRGVLKDVAAVTAATEAASQSGKLRPAKKQKAAFAQPEPKAKTTKAKADKPSVSGNTDSAAATKPKTTKHEQVQIILSKDGGKTIEEIMKSTGWQQHSVRGFFAGTVRKKLGFDLTLEKGEGGERRYVIKVKT